MNAAFKLSESISKILLNQADSSYDSEKSFDESDSESIISMENH